MNRNPLCNHYLVSSNEYLVKDNHHKKQKESEPCVSLINGSDEHSEWLINNLTADICQALSCQPCDTHEEAVTYLTGSSVTKLIRHAKHGLIGACGYHQVIGGDVEIFYWLIHQYRGRGYAKQAVKLLFSELSACKSAIIAEVFATNDESINLLKSLDFEVVQRGSVRGKSTFIFRKTSPNF